MTTSSSRRLTAIPILYQSNMTSNATDAFKICVFYESSSGNVSAILDTQTDHGYSDFSEQDQLSWNWQNISSRLYTEVSGASLGSPFAAIQSFLIPPELPDSPNFKPFKFYALNASATTLFSGFQYYPENNIFMSCKPSSTRIWRVQS